MSKNKRRTRQKLFDLAFILTIIAGLTIYAYQKGRLTFTNSRDLPTIPLPTPVTNIPTGPKTYVNNDFSYQFEYSSKTDGCDKQISTSPPWLMDKSVYGIDVYCDKGPNLVQVITEKTDKDINTWWYSLLSENKTFFEKYGEMKDIVFVGEKAKQISYQKNGDNEHYNQVEIIFQQGGINYLIVALDYLCSTKQNCWQGSFEQKVLNSFKIIKTVKATPTSTNLKGQGCGGILGRVCPDGYTCKYDKSFPDATGVCTKI